MKTSALPIKPRKRLKRVKPEALAVPESPKMVWSIDFMADQLGIAVDFLRPAEREIRTLNRIIEWRGQPDAIRIDNGSVYISERLKG